MKKKIIAAMLVFGTVATLGLGACGKTTSQSSSSQTTTEQSASSESMAGGDSVVNPMTSYDSMDEMKQAAGGNCCIVRPEGNVTDESFSTLKADNGSVIAQYDFTLDGVHYTARFCSDCTVPISGFYTEDGEAFSSCDTSDDLFTGFAYVKNDSGFCSHWMNVSGQYTLQADAGSVSQTAEKAFAEFAQNYKDLTLPDQEG